MRLFGFNVVVIDGISRFRRNPKEHQNLFAMRLPVLPLVLPLSRASHKLLLIRGAVSARQHKSLSFRSWRGASGAHKARMPWREIFVPGRMAVAERDALRAAGAVFDAAARSVDKCKQAIDRAKAFAEMRGQQVAKIDAVVLALTERAAEAARSYVSGDVPEPPIGLPELRRAHGARELAQAAFDLARRTVEALEGELSDAEALAGKAQATAVGVALGVLVVRTEKRAADLVQAQTALADERGLSALAWDRVARDRCSSANGANRAQDERKGPRGCGPRLPERDNTDRG